MTDKLLTPAYVPVPPPALKTSAQSSPNSRSGRLPSLDGLRAVSIFLVFLAHLCGSRGFLSERFLLFDYGRFGVRVFFIISGFLITSLLIAERNAHGRVSLGLFYSRRSIRIFPAAYCYVALITAFSLWGAYHISSADVWRAVAYVMNWWPSSMRAWQLGHLWSLSVEEQFYLIWPLLFLITPRRKTAWAALGMILLSVTFRLADRVLFFRTAVHQLDEDWFPFLADSLAAGCLLALTGNWLQRQNWYKRILRPTWSLLLLGCTVILVRYEQRTAIIWVFGATFINLAIAVLVHRSVEIPNDRLGRLLNSAPLKAIGVLSYSLYLWQQPFLNRFSQSWFCTFPQNVIFASGAALLSYNLVERPFLKIRHRLRARSTG